MSDDIYNVPSNSMKAKEKEQREERSSDRPAIRPRKKGIGSFFRAMVDKGDVDSVSNIFANAMINAVGDTIDEVTGNLTHRAKTILYGTEDYDRGRNSSRRGDRYYNSYSKYYDEKNKSNRPSGSVRGSSGNQDESGKSSKSRWKYNDVFFDQRIFGKRGAELAAWRVIRKMDEQISDPETECVSVGDFFRYCLEEDPENRMIVPEFTDENLGWDNEEDISNLKPVSIPGGYIIELPKPKAL